MTKQQTKRGTGILNNFYKHFVDGLKRTYCPQQYMHANCGKSWDYATNGIMNRMVSKYVQFDERVKIGVTSNLLESSNIQRY